MNYSNFEIIDEMEKSKETGQITDKLSDVFIQIANRRVNTKQYENYRHLHEDMKQEVMLHLIRCFPTFKPDKSTKAFSYLWVVSQGACLNVLSKENRINNINMVETRIIKL